MRSQRRRLEQPSNLASCCKYWDVEMGWGKAKGVEGWLWDQGQGSISVFSFFRQSSSRQLSSLIDFQVLLVIIINMQAACFYTRMTVSDGWPRFSVLPRLHSHSISNLIQITQINSKRQDNHYFIKALPISHSRISCVPAPISYNLASLKSRPVGYQLMQPLPPKAWIAQRATSVPHLEVKQMTLAQSRLDRWPASTTLQQLYSIAREACSFVYIYAILPCISWKWPIGLPNCWRVFTQFRVMSRADCMMPTGPAARTSLSQSSPLINTQTPLLSWPKMFSSGISTFSNTSSPVLEPLMPSLSSFWAQEKPFVPFSTRNAVMPLSFKLGSVLAQTTRTSASGPLVIHILLPFRTYLLPFFSARSFMEVTSEPAPGSDMARAPMCSPEHSLGRYFIFCSSVPWRVI